MNNNFSKEEGRSIDHGLPPDIVFKTLPYLSASDIKSLSLTNKYYNKLLDYENSNTLWHELYRKSFEYGHRNDEPFISNRGQDYTTCLETVLVNNYPDISWKERYRHMEQDVSFYSWGSLQNSRLGYTVNSNPAISFQAGSHQGRRYVGISKPTPVPWFNQLSSSENPTKDKINIGQVINQDHKIIVQISSGGYSFQLLTKSGKLFSTGSTYNGNNRGPGPKDEQSDFNVLQHLILSMEHNFPRRVHESIITTGMFAVNDVIRLIPNPHQDTYRSVSNLLKKCEEYVYGNKNIRRLFPRDAFNFYKDEGDFTVDERIFDAIKFVSVASGRAHILALDGNNELYTWDSPGMDHGIRILLEGLPSRLTNPILKIRCGWDFSCVYIHSVGLVFWDSRSALKKGDMASKADYKIIPNTGDVNGKNRIVDFACCSANSVFYITNDGHTLWLHRNGESKQIDLQLDGLLTKIKASCMALVLFTEQCTYTLRVVNGEVVENSLQKIDLGPDKKFIDISAGDYHNLGLTSDGELFSWGLESDLCGCLGQGDASEAVEVRQVASYESSRSIRISNPTLIELPPNSICVAIVAGGWQSGALILNKG